MREFRTAPRRPRASSRGAATAHGRPAAADRPSLRLLLPLWLALCTGEAVLGQPAAPPAAKPPDSDEVTAASIEEIRTQAAASEDLAAETKEKIETAAKQALDSLQKIGEAAANAQQYEQDAESIGERAAILKGEFEALERGPEPLPEGLTLRELEQEVSSRGVELAQLKAELAKLEAVPMARVNRRREIRSLLLSSNQRLEEIRKQLELPAPPEEKPLETAVRRAALTVSAKLIEAQQPELQNELAKYDAEDAADLLRLERDARTREVQQATQALETLNARLAALRAADSAAKLDQARENLEATPPPLKEFAQENVELAETADNLTKPIAEAAKKLDSAQKRLEEVQKQFTQMRQRIDEIGLTGSIGVLLRRQRMSLPDLRQRRSNVVSRKSLIEETQHDLFEYDDQRSEPVEATTSRMLENVTATDRIQYPGLKLQAEAIVERRRDHLDGVMRNHNEYLDTLFDLDATEQRLIRETERFATYIDERVLWIRSNRSLFASLTVDASDRWVLDPQQWDKVWSLMEQDLRSYPFIYIAAFLAFVMLLLKKRRLSDELVAAGEAARRGSCIDFTPTLRAGWLTLLLAITWPGIVFFLAWRLNAAASGEPFPHAVAQALYTVSWAYFPLELLRRVCRSDGLAESHFDWSSSTIAVFRSSLRWATIPGLTVVFVTSLLYFSAPEHGNDAIERIAFLMGLVIMTLLVRRILRPDIGVFREYLALHPGGWMERLKLVWYGGALLIPVSIGVMTVAGFYYTAQQLIWRLYASFVFVVTLQLLRAFLRRLLLIRRRAISIHAARERRAELAAERESRVQAGAVQAEEAEHTLEQLVPVDDKPDIVANTEKTRRLISTGLVVFYCVGTWLIWIDVLPALRFLHQWPVWTTTVPAQTAALNPGSGPNDLLSNPTSALQPVADAALPTDEIRIVTVADIGLAILIGIVTVLCARNVPGLMEISILQRLPLDNSVRYAITTVTSYIIVLLGVVLAFNAISVGWSKVQWLATALTFGLAFGLQEIFANFVAGLILLLERPIRVGDVVTVDDVTGVVSRIRIRATTITDWDRKEYIVPNKEFITGRTLNWTLSDRTNRLVLNIGIAYGSDVAEAKRLLLQICHDHPVVLDDPPTLVTFEGFGDNTLNLVVRTYLPSLENRLAAIDDLHSMIDTVFRRAGIEIAFPQRDLHLRSVDADVWSRLQPEAVRETH